MFDLDAYLARIGLADRTPALAELHRAHITAIPFENLDPQRGVAPSLAIEDLERKLVTERRGGYCFEHNLLFAAALRALGAEVEPLLARVLAGGAHARERPRTHLALRVEWQGARWQADVGFGRGTLLEPIPFARPGEVFTQEGWRFRVLTDGTALILQAAAGPAWEDLYVLDPEPAPMIDVETSNWFAATHPSSPFVTGLLVCRYRADASRSTLSDFGGETQLIEDTPTDSQATPVARGRVPELLAADFGLPGFALDGRGRVVPAGTASLARLDARHVFLGAPVSDFAAAMPFYETLLGRPADVLPHAEEAMWQLNDRGWIYVVRDPSRAGRGLLTLLFDDLAAELARIGARGVTLGAIEEKPGRYRRTVLSDPDGNRITLGQPLTPGGREGD